jgi:protease-4
MIEGRWEMARALFRGGVCLLAGGSAAWAGPPAPSVGEVAIPWAVPAEDEGSESVLGHAAGLGFLPSYVEGGVAVGARVLGSGRVATVTGLAAGRYGPIAAGLGISWLGESAAFGLERAWRVDLGLAARIADEVSLGIAWHGVWDERGAGFDGLSSFALSGTFRPLRELSIALAIDRFNSPEVGGAALRPVARGGMVVRPGVDRLAIGADGGVVLAAAPSWYAGMSLRVMLVPGLELGGYARVIDDGPLAVAWGAALSLSQSLVTGSISVDGRAPIESAAEERLGGSVLVTAGMAARPSLAVPGDPVMTLVLQGEIREAAPDGVLEDGPVPFAFWLAALELAGLDPSTAGILVKIEASPSWAQCWELRERLVAAKQRGKRVFAWLTQPDMKGMFLASAADRVWLQPAGALWLVGLQITRTYLKGLLEHLGIQAEFVQYEEYKSFPEQFTQTAPSGPAEEQTRVLLERFDRAWMAAVSEGRGIAAPELQKTLADGPQTMHMAVEQRLVDALVHEDALGETIAKEIGRPVHLVRHWRPSPRAWRAWGGQPKIAVIPIVGSIVDGESGRDIPYIGEETTGDATFRRHLEAAVRDARVAGIVVRVVSPGGAALASDRMCRAVGEAAKRKPLVVSFGNIAASGGYYAAMGARRILATPFTITGSIGIFNGKADLSGLYKLVGLSTHTQKTAPRADVMEWHRPWTEEERSVAMARLKPYYDQFVEAVAAGRGLDPETARSRAKGRVYAGEEALEARLVDRMGSLWDAIGEVKRAAGLGGTSVGILYLPDLDLFDRLGKFLSGARGLVLESAPVGTAPTPPSFHALGPAARLLGMLIGLETSPFLARMPYDLEIH